MRACRTASLFACLLFGVALLPAPGCSCGGGGAAGDGQASRHAGTAAVESGPSGAVALDGAIERWLAEHEERGQSFLEYREGDPVLPDVRGDGEGRRKVLYIQPLGPLTESQQTIVTLTADYMARFFALPVRIQDELPLSLIPPEAQRKHPSWGTHQILTSYVLDEVLSPRLPVDAAAYLSFTATDLWPGKGWNFVFGQASLRKRVGVWSIHRNGDPAVGASSFRRALMRAVKTAVHETGHMFSMAHCTHYECAMAGANNRDESDGHPLWLCPECMAKVCWATGADPAERYRRLGEFARGHGFAREAAFFDTSREVLRR
jgi:archaemetzincin